LSYLIFIGTFLVQKIGKLNKILSKIDRIAKFRAPPVYLLIIDL